MALLERLVGQVMRQESAGSRLAERQPALAGVEATWWPKQRPAGLSSRHRNRCRSTPASANQSRIRRVRVEREPRFMEGARRDLRTRSVAKNEGGWEHE